MTLLDIDVADTFGTPTYVIDENDFRQHARRCRKSLRGFEVVHAGKSLLTTTVARWAHEEGLGIDICSPAELAVALAGGIDPARIILHGNAVSPEEMRAAVTVGAGRIVVDSGIEIAYLAGLAKRRQRVLVRVTPHVDSHGHRAVTRVLAHPTLDLIGLHCHIGSPVTDAELYGETIRRMIAAMADVRARHGVILTELSIVGGHGVSHVRGDAKPSLHQLAVVIEDALDEACAAEHFPRPAVAVDPVSYSS